jgi:hypothetical protein
VWYNYRILGLRDDQKTGRKCPRDAQGAGRSSHWEFRLRFNFSHNFETHCFCGLHNHNLELLLGEENVSKGDQIVLPIYYILSHKTL